MGEEGGDGGRAAETSAKWGIGKKDRDGATFHPRNFYPTVLPLPSHSICIRSIRAGGPSLSDMTKWK